MKIIKVTIDTSITNKEWLKPIIQELNGKSQIQICTTTVTKREQGNEYNFPGATILESGIFNESLWDNFTWENLEGLQMFESILNTMSNGSFPKSGNRSAKKLSDGEKHLLRDAQILRTHVRAKRDILVSNDIRAFVGKNGMLRKKLESITATKILTGAEFLDFCKKIKNEP